MAAPVLEIIPAGRYIVMIDVLGNETWLEQPEGAAILVFDGTQFYWADGSDEKQLNFGNVPATEEAVGLLAMDANGRVLSLTIPAEDPVDNVERMAVLENGVWTLRELDLVGLPDTGYGILLKPDGEDPAWFQQPFAMLYTDVNGETQFLDNGTNGQILKMVAGLPQWQDPEGGSVGVGISSTGLEGATAASVGVEQVNVKAPSFTVSDGATDITLVNINFTVDLSNPNGLLGLDIGGEGNSKWYYVYVITDGVTPSAIISDDPSGPDFTNAAGYTHWGLISVFRNDGAGNIVTFVQRGRQFWTTPVVWGNNLSSTTAFAVINSGTNLNTILPPNVKACSGVVGGSTTNTVARSMLMASSAGGLAKQAIGSYEQGTTMENFRFDCGSFHMLPIVDPNAPALYWRSNANNNQRRIEITGYTV